MTVSTLCLMVPNSRGGQTRNPPAWDPGSERNPYDAWISDLMSWQILVTNSMDTAEQAAAIRLSLGGPAKEFYRVLPYEIKTQGGIINCQQNDFVTWLVFNLGQRFAPLAEEQRLAVTNDCVVYLGSSTLKF